MSGRAARKVGRQLARWLDGARELIDMAPERFRLPDVDGLVEFMRQENDSQPDMLSLVADLDGEIVAALAWNSANVRPDRRPGSYGKYAIPQRPRSGIGPGAISRSELGYE